MINNKMLIILICISVFIPIHLYSQKENSIGYPNRIFDQSDSVGKYDIDCVVLGIVKLDSLVGVTYWYRAPYKDSRKYKSFSYKKRWSQYATDYFLTFKKNIPINRNLPYQEVESLVYNKDFFLLESRCRILYNYIYPRCNEEEKKRIEYTLKNYRISIDNVCLPTDSTWMDCIKYIKYDGRLFPDVCFYYHEYTEANEFLLVLMNRKWVSSLRREESEPPKRCGYEDAYVKYLIPLKTMDE